MRMMSVTMLREKMRSARVGRPYAMERDDIDAPCCFAAGEGG
jgi:hypothetical protein